MFLWGVGGGGEGGGINMSFGEDDGLGVFVSSAASMTCCVFFAVINDAGDYPILSAYRACRDARRRVETGVSPCDAGGVGGIPPTFARTRATDSSHTSHRLPGGVSRRRCPSHTTVFCGVAAITQRRSRIISPAGTSPGRHSQA